jgi:hypothetical protein
MKQGDDNSLYDTWCPECKSGGVRWLGTYTDSEGNRQVVWKCPNEDCVCNTPWRYRPYLTGLWRRKRLSLGQMSDTLGCSKRTVSRWLRRLDVDRVDHLQTKWVNGYHVLRHKDGEANRKVRIHRLIAVAEQGIDEVKDKDVHHKNGHRMDNRPSNLELLDPPEHGRVTREQEYNRLFGD